MLQARRGGRSKRRMEKRDQYQNLGKGPKGVGAAEDAGDVGPVGGHQRRF